MTRELAANVMALGWCPHCIFDLGHNFLTRSDSAFIMQMCIACDKTFHIVP